MCIYMYSIVDFFFFFLSVQYSKSVLNAKGMKKNEKKRQSSKQRANRKIQLMDDSTFSETSQDEERY